MKKRILGFLSVGLVLATLTLSFSVEESDAQFPDCNSGNAWNLYLNHTNTCINFACNCVGLDPVIIKAPSIN
jgi:hypothetical protein